MITVGTRARRSAIAFGLAWSAAAAAHAAGTVGTSLPAGFAVNDASLGTPVIGFGASGRALRTPVVFLHDNDDTPYHDTSTCGRWKVQFQAMAQFLADSGYYSTSELWALGYQGRQCDRIDTPTVSAGLAHTITANVVDLRNFVAAVLASTGAAQVDVVGHGMGATLAREWVRQDGVQKLVRRFVAIDAPNNGTIMCSAHAQNPWRLAFSGGFTVDSPVCQELGSPDTPFLKLLNRASARIDPKDTLVIRNSLASFPFMPQPDNLTGGVGTPVVDCYNTAADFSESPRIKRAAEEFVNDGQGAYDYSGGGTAHVGIANSPETWKRILQFLTKP